MKEAWPEQKMYAAIITIMGTARCLAARPPGSRYKDPGNPLAPPSSPYASDMRRRGERPT